MSCEYSENCVYYNTYRYKSSEKQYRLLVESYCEGQLQSMCRRKQHEESFGKAAPDELAPNGYLVGTHKKINTQEIRKHERHKVENGACMLQVLTTKKTFSAWIVDISEGGVCLELNIHPKELDISPKKSLLKILGYSINAIPFPITKVIVQPVWQDNQMMGCSFVTTPS